MSLFNFREFKNFFIYRYTWSQQENIVHLLNEHYILLILIIRYFHWLETKIPDFRSIQAHMSLNITSGFTEISILFLKLVKSKLVARLPILKNNLRLWNLLPIDFFHCQRMSVVFV